METHSLSTNIKKPVCYFDNAATTKPKEEVVNIVNTYLIKKWHNPSSLYSKAHNIAEDIKKARIKIGKYIGAKEKEIYFTSGGSESNCWAIQGFVNYWLLKGKQPIIITSTIEHKSIMECVENLLVDIHFVGVNRYGQINLKQLETILKTESNKVNTKILVSIQGANNEIGVIQNIPKIAEVVHKYSAYLHSDYVQIIGHLPENEINVRCSDVDMISASAHKFGCIKGIGFLYIKQGVNILPLIYGSQNNGMRGGTENVAGIVSMAKALDLCESDKCITNELMKRAFIEKIKTLPYNISFNNLMGYQQGLSNLISITIRERITAEALVYMMDSNNFFISSGSACNSHSNKPSYVLKAIGLTDKDITRTLRITFDDSITLKNIDDFVFEINKAIKILTS